MILDTNALSAWFDGNPQVDELIRAQHHLAVPVVVLGEYRFGIALSRLRKDREARLQILEDNATVLDIDRETARCFASIRLALRKAGSPIPSNDMWIAALALQHTLPLLSRDGHFDAVAGVRRLAW